MTYSEAVASAPPGAATFAGEDLERLPADTLDRFLGEIPAGELALFRAGDGAAVRRVLRAAFWTLVYNLLPERWDELSRAEPIHPGLLAALPADGVRVLEVGAGSGRLTVNLAPRARALIAIEPSAPLRAILVTRVAGVAIVEGVAQELPVVGGWADLTTSCASLGPDPACIQELERCTRAGGTIALVSPENPDWFEANGWRRLSFEVGEMVIPPHNPALEEFFGPLAPPHELLLWTA